MLLRRLRQSFSWGKLVALFALLAFAFLLQSSVASPVMPAKAADILSLPTWENAGAISNVFAVTGVPEPQYSLDGGDIPSGVSASTALRDAGVDALVSLMEAKGDYFYQTAAHPNGLFASDDVIVLKVNNQWGGEGSDDGEGRLATNTDVLKGLIWRVVQHPDGFTGEIIVAENVQPISSMDWDVTLANAQDQEQSFQDVVSAFQGLGYPVSFYDWTTLNDSRVSGGLVDGAGYPVGEYIHGNMDDVYILLEDPEAAGTDELSYPKFQTAGGTYVSMRYGIWNGTDYDSERLAWINIPVLKIHGMAGATIAWKNLIGFVTAEDNDVSSARYGSWSQMHNYYWGYQGGSTYGLLGREMAMIRAPDLHIVDAIWVAYESNWRGSAIRQGVLLASVDPFAIDWYASEYVLLPLTGSQGASAARSGTFRDATRVNQNSALLKWPGGSSAYPYIDLLDSTDDNQPSQDEREQMNVYVASAGALCEPITDVGVVGPTWGFTDTHISLSVVITPASATVPITYTWSPAPLSGQGLADIVYQWNTAGDHTVMVEAENCGVSSMMTHTVTVADQRWSVYIPFCHK